MKWTQKVQSVALLSLVFCITSPVGEASASSEQTKQYSTMWTHKIKKKKLFGHVYLSTTLKIRVISKVWRWNGRQQCVQSVAQWSLNNTKVYHQKNKKKRELSISTELQQKIGIDSLSLFINFSGTQHKLVPGLLNSPGQNTLQGAEWSVNKPRCHHYPVPDRIRDVSPVQTNDSSHFVSISSGQVSLFLGTFKKELLDQIDSTTHYKKIVEAARAQVANIRKHLSLPINRIQSRVNQYIAQSEQDAISSLETFQNNITSRAVPKQFIKSATALREFNRKKMAIKSAYQQAIQALKSRIKKERKELPAKESAFERRRQEKRRYIKSIPPMRPIQIVTPNPSNRKKGVFTSKKLVFHIKGKVDSTIKARTLTLMSVGMKQSVSIDQSGTFSTKVILSRGLNWLRLLVKSEGRQYVRSIKVLYNGPIIKLRATLTWDSTADLDLHTRGEGSHCSHSLRMAGHMKLDVDDTSGYGPENISVNSRAKGIYRVSVKNYSNGIGTKATVHIFLNGRRLETKSHTFQSSKEVWVVGSYNLGDIKSRPRGTHYKAGWFGFSNSQNMDKESNLQRRCARKFKRVYVPKVYGTTFSGLCRSIGLVCRRVCDWEGKAKSCQDSPYDWGDGSRLAYCAQPKIQRQTRSESMDSACFMARTGCVKLIRRRMRKKKLSIKLKNRCRGRIYIQKCIEYRRKGQLSWDCGSSGVRRGGTTSWYSYGATGRFHIRYIGVKKASKDWVCTKYHATWSLDGAAFQATNPPSIPRN
jgi:uncharacterized protein YfaP (DUF2135 family)